jgi:hypothetical protein
VRSVARFEDTVLRPQLLVFEDRSDGGTETPPAARNNGVCNFVQTFVVTEEHRSRSSHHNQGGSVPKNRGKERCHGSCKTLPLERG